MKRFVLAAGAACALAVAGCGRGGQHHRVAVASCQQAPAGSPHALAAKEGLACPSRLPKAVRGAVRSAGLQEMDDSTDLSALAGTNYPAYAGYTDGLYQSYPDIYNYFHPRGKQTVGIDVNGGTARATDLEPSPGNFQNNPYSSGPWARSQIQNTFNKRPLIYTMGSWQGAIEQSLADNGVPRCSTPSQQGCYLEWIAVWDNNPVLYAHMTVHQFIDHGPNGENRDRSVYDPTMLFGPGIDQRSFNMGWKTGYATGTSIPAKVGFDKTFHPKAGPASTADYNTGYRAGYSKGWYVDAHNGQTSGANTPTHPTDYNGNYRLGFNNGWAIQVWNPFYGYWKLTRHVSSNASAFNAGYVKGKSAGYNSDFNWGWHYGASGI